MTVCPSCGTESREGARFCDSCGAVLAPATAQGREERKTVSVLFCDLVGFTADSERVDPEDVRARLRPYHELLRDRIEAHGGIVEKFVGDAVMAVFGAPAAHEDDAERAVRAGLAILNSLVELNAADPALALEVRIGVNTGEVLVSLDAHPERGEAIVTGDVVNTAARIQTAAPVDGVAVGEETYRATELVFEWQELEPVKAKGKNAPLALMRPLRPLARGRDGVSAHSTPFVGREVEKTLMLGLLDRCIRDRTAQLVTVIGEPGVGKSRQVAELLADAERRPQAVHCRRGRCLPYGDSVAFWALGEIVKAHASIFEGDGPERAREKLRAVLPGGGEGAWLEERLLPLVGVEAATRAERGESFAAWRTFLESIAERDPLVLVFEDLQWADPALLDFLAHLVERASGVPLLVVCTARPELADQAPGWAGGLRNATTITLNPLSETETARLVNELLEQVVLPAGLQRAITDRAGGNPLYAEEVARLLRDRGLLDDPAALEGLPLPETVQALIAARLDTLPAEWKGLLQDASVLGRVFWTGAVAAIGAGTIAHVERGLGELERQELVRTSRTSSLEGERELAFWHMLVRDVAYGQIPRSQRAVKHLRTADWIEGEGRGRVEDVADVLAHHLGEAFELFTAAGEDALAGELRPRVRRALVLAAERALALDPSHAVTHLDRALELTPEDAAERADLAVSWAWAVFQAGGNVRDAADALDAALPELRARSDRAPAATALVRRAILARLLGEDTHIAFAEEAVALLEPLGTSRALVDALTELAGTLTASAVDLDLVVAVVDRAEALSRDLGIELPARALGFRGAARFELGSDAGLRELDEAFERLVAAGAARNAGVVIFNRARSLWEIEGPRSLERFEEARDFSLARGQEQLARFALRGIAIQLADQGRYDDLAELAAHYGPALERGGELETVWAIRSWLAWSNVLRVGTEARAEVAALRDQAVGEAKVYASLVDVVEAGYAGDRARARKALVEVSGHYWTSQAAVRGHWPWIVRAAARTGEVAVVREPIEDWLRSRERAAPRPYLDTVVTATRALLAEIDGDHEQAAELAASVVEPLAEFLAFPDRGYAFLLLGKARAALGDPSAGEALRRARGVFTELGMRPALAEVDAALAGAVLIGA
jgi:class 3 adenylate cyclase